MFACDQNITGDLHTGFVKPGSREILECHFLARPGKSWNLIVGMESHGE